MSLSSKVSGRPRRIFGAVSAVLIMLAVASCGSSAESTDSSTESTPPAATGESPAATDGGSSSEPGTSGSEPADEPDFLVEARAAVEEGYKGLWREPAPGPAAVRDKKVVVIPCGVAVGGCYAPAKAVEDGASNLGWTVTMLDGKLTPAGYSAAIQQAIAQNPDGIITVGIDCGLAKSAYGQAKEAGIPVVGIYELDCNDPSVGDPEGLMTTMVDTGYGQDVGAWSASTGAITAQYLIAKTDGKAKVLEFAQEGYTNVEYIHKGFEAEFAKCTTCEIVQKVTFDPADVVAGNIASKVTSGLLSAPEADAIFFDNDGNLTMAIPALKANLRPDQMVMGHEGLPATLPLIGKEVTALFAFSPTWLGWCGLYTMNEVFADHPITDCGLGLQILDAENNPQDPNAAEVASAIDYQAIMKAQWDAS